MNEVTLNYRMVWKHKYFPSSIMVKQSILLDISNMTFKIIVT